MAPVKNDCLPNASSRASWYRSRSGGESRAKMPKKTAADMKEILRKADAVCFDVDSTVLEDEAIDQLAVFCGVGEEVERMTASAMNGGISFRKALGDRLRIMRPSLEVIAKYVRENPPKLTKGIREFVDLLQTRGTQVYLVSGGFESVIHPLARELNIPNSNIFANRLLFYHNGEYAGFDHNQPTSESGGKIRVAEYLKSKFSYKNLLFIGDGMTDLETYPTADGFIGFGGNQVREAVKELAPWFVHSFQELIDTINES